ncbi:hypothetical protein K431DRAFT_299492 [Polychaeton citri CBS 116435]|uniref:DNA2/NAM7 helicase-like C-terminal domain-containing protein n=1 Tax=Polychaeton citri CBS 116435 TaxID=1314669 RepID=A0A9P4QGC6_9PEZI|nr:hypothetical protein K431DRAFT_299492 [Polychaeton citri CBS 116435]
MWMQKIVEKYQRTESHALCSSQPCTPASHSPVTFSGTNALDHHCLVVDAVTKRRVDADTTLAALYQLDDPTIDNTLLRNLTREAQPESACAVNLPDLLQFYPPCSDPSTDYRFTVTFDKLLIAPVLRLRCWVKRGSYDHAISLDFHFVDSGEHAPALECFQWFAGNVSWSNAEQHGITFTSKGATVSGLNFAESGMSEPQNEVVNALRQLAKVGSPKKIKLRLFEPAPTITELRHLLPGGSSKLLSSLQMDEYSALGTTQEVLACDHKNMKKPEQLMSLGFPMVPLECNHTFSTLKEAAVQLSYSAYLSDIEAREALALWAKVHHSGRLMRVGTIAVLAVNFSQHGTLGNARNSVKYRLPSQLYVDMYFSVARGLDTCYQGYLMPDLPTLPAHDAYFVITSKSAEHFGEQLSRSMLEEPTLLFDVKIRPSMPLFGLRSQLQAVKDICRTENSRWHPILLNQIHEDMPEVNLAQVEDLAQDIIVYERLRLRNFVPNWNKEQLSVIEGIERTKGGCMVVMGPAGTGKTLLQQALAIYFWKLGYHVLAVTPANSNADHLTRIMAKLNEPHLRFHRLYPSSCDLGPEGLNGERGDVSADMNTYTEIQFALKRLKDHQHDRTGARDFDLERAVIDEADKGENRERLTLLKQPPASLKHLGVAVDVWGIFRNCLHQIRMGEFDQGDLNTLHRYAWAFRECKAHIIRITRFIITTTGNCRATELLEKFGRDVQTGYVNMKQMVVFIDEACKDTEVNLWSAIICREWASKVRGCIMFGDDKQLKPTNVSSRGDLEFNPWNDRLELPLPVRLAEQGFPIIELKEQMRMHRAIADFPNRMFYDSRLRNGVGTNRTLATAMPGLHMMLMSIMAPTITDPAERLDLNAWARDEQCRVQWVEVQGEIEQHPRTKSVKVAAHAEVFFQDIFPKLHLYFGDTMEEHVMVICAYSYALHHWSALASRKAKELGLPTKHLPRIVMLDASQGQESFMVIFDGSLQFADRLGFLLDAGRCNVATTRAQGVFWMIGGRMSYRRRSKPTLEGNMYFPLYRKELEEKNMLHLWNQKD